MLLTTTVERGEVHALDFPGRRAAERIPNRSSKSPARKREQKKRWFRNGQKWRTGSEGRISVVKRHHGLTRCRYKGLVGMNRWVGLGVIGDNLLTLGNALAKTPDR